LIRSLLVLAVFVPVAACLPLAAMTLTRTPEGTQALFWIGPWSAAFWTLLYSQFSAAPWRQGREAVHRWREEHGGLLHTSFWACAWMFGSLFFSYVAEALLIRFTRSTTLLPLACYSPLAFCWLWRKTHG
jgi:hypothetical protein